MKTLKRKHLKRTILKRRNQKNDKPDKRNELAYYNSENKKRKMTNPEKETTNQGQF